MLLCGALISAAPPALAQYVQQGPKLVYSGEIGAVEQGVSVAVAAANPTILVGAPSTLNNTGMAVVFVRSNSVWTQQGGELHPNNEVGDAFFGWRVSLSSDGNTALIGGPSDNNNIGAAWVFVRNNGVWQQQAKLIGTGAIGGAQQGSSVALSADGNTAIVGGDADNESIGAAWVFTRSNNVWTQQAKLVGSNISNIGVFGYSVGLSANGLVAIVGASQQTSPGAAWVFSRTSGVWSQQALLIGSSAIGNARQGISVALSGEGDTALVGGPWDNNEAGAVWVFMRTGNGWAEQAKLTGGGAVGNAFFGGSVALPFSDTGPALVGGPLDNGSIGAAWVFARRIDGSWSQQGAKMVGSGAVSTNNQGVQEGGSVALSPLDGAGHDAGIAVIGGLGDTNDLGATWVFTVHNAAASHDFDADSHSDILWHDTSGDVGMWLMNGATISQNAGVANVPTVWSIAGQRDFDGNGKADILWHDTGGNVGMWLMNGTQIASAAGIANVPTVWSVAGTGDFNGDGFGDILWHDTSGNVGIWLMNGTTIVTNTGVANVPAVWSIAGTGDFNGDGMTDILWSNTSGQVGIWFMNGTQITQAVGVGQAPPGWSIVGTGDFNGDRFTDILWRDTAGDVGMWLMSGASIVQATGVANVPTVWSVAETGDYNNDGKSDIVWHDSSGNVGVWLMNGTTIATNSGIANVPTAWSIQGAGAD